MRLMVFYDLPVVSKAERKAYSQFHRFLVKSGYDMLQFSVYSRICNGQEAVDKQMARLSKNLPSKGSVRLMQVTEKQFAGVRVLVGEKTVKEKPEYTGQMLLF